jgi:hypothetical protein
MTPEQFSDWGLVFALSAATASLALAILIFYSMLQDKRVGIPVIIAFAIIGIARMAQNYMLSAIAVVLIIPVVAYFSIKNWKQTVIWINSLLFLLATPIALYAYRVLYLH